MNATLVSFLVLGGVMLGIFCGIALQRWLPHDHIAGSSKDSIRLVMGLITTMSALVLGLLVASAKSSYDNQRDEIANLAAQIVQLDRVLSRYGEETAGARAEFRATVEGLLHRIWPGDKSEAPSLHWAAAEEGPADFYTAILILNPQTNAQRLAQTRALDIGADIGRRQVLMYAQSTSAIPVPFLVVLVFWLVILFVGFGLFAPSNATVLIALLVGALSVAGAIGLILHLDRPYEGLMQLSESPLRAALTEISP